MNHGGTRTGAGRKRKADAYAGAITRAEKKIKDVLPDIVDSQIALALGVKVQDKGDVYTKPPDRAACEYLINRILGKPTERIEQETDGTLRIRVEYDDPAESSGTE